MPFYNFNDLNPKQPAEGVELKVVSGNKMTLVTFYLSPGSAMPEHSHPHEQMGLIVKGKLELTIGDEKKTVAKGDAWHIPSDVSHKGVCLDEPAEVVEVFAPPREDYAD